MNIPGVYASFLEKWKDRQTVWLYSDPHFGDLDLISSIKSRPNDDIQIKNINSKVGKKDVLIILGDCGDLDSCAKLRGYKILIMGNHDTGSSKYRDIFDEVYEGPVFLGEKLLLSHEPILLPFAFNIHGHVHYKTKEANSLNVCADAIAYTPINLNQLMKQGLTAKIISLHRDTISSASKRKKNKTKC